MERTCKLAVLTFVAVGMLAGCIGDLSEKEIEPLDEGVDKVPEASFDHECKGLTCTFEATKDQHDPGALDYHWELGDGTFSSEGSPKHTYETPGSYEVRLTVTDARNRSDIAAREVSVQELEGPSAFLGHECDGQTCSFDASASKPGETSIEAYEWDLGDGTTATGQEVQHNYRWDGAYTVTLNVTDANGLVDRVSIEVTALEEPVEVEVPVQVVLAGFEDGVAEQLASRLGSETVRQRSIDYDRAIPPDPNDPGPPSLVAELTTGDIPTAKLPLVPTAAYQVHEASKGTVEELKAFLDTAEVDDAPETTYDANAVEQWLSQNLPVPMDPNAPTLVLLHTGDTGGHNYRLTYENGWIQDIRAFGEKEPLLVLDVSADPDPYVQGEGSVEVSPDGVNEDRSRPYDKPLSPGGTDTVEALEAAVLDATQFRLLQGSLYPVATEPCHAITLVLGIRETAITEKHPDYRDSEDLFDPEALAGSFERLMGEDAVYVDTLEVHLPQDDPALDAISRGGLASADAAHYWIDENWDDYWVPREGCEAYVSFLILGDAADHVVVWGLGMYDVDSDRRVAFSIVPEYQRVQDEDHPPFSGTGDSRDRHNYVNHLFAHETGHILGQRHTHDVHTEDDETRIVKGFSSVWSPMSYQNGDRTVQFGTVDQANQLRNRAGYALQAAIDEGLEGTPEVQQALEHLQEQRWEQAWHELAPLLH